MLQAWLPAVPVYFLVSADAGLGGSSPVPSRRSETKAWGGLDQDSGAQAVWLLAVYTGCFILHRVIHAKVAWAREISDAQWEDVVQKALQARQASPAWK